MMGSLFILFVVEMWLHSKTGGHSHGGATGRDIIPVPNANGHGEAVLASAPAYARERPWDEKAAYPDEKAVYPRE